MDQKQLLEEIRGQLVIKNHEKLKQLLSLTDFKMINDQSSGDSLLDVAVRTNDCISVELLLIHGAIPNYKQPQHTWSTSTLAQAIGCGNPKIVQLLVNQGCNPDTPFELTDHQYVVTDITPNNYWYQVIVRKDLPMFQCLLECKGQKIGNDEWHRKILLLACASGSVRIVEYLLDQGLSIESADEKNWTCLFYAVAYKQIRAAQLLTTRGANLKHKDIEGCSLLHICILHCKTVSFNRAHKQILIQLLIDEGVDINATDNNGLTPINAVFSVTDVNHGVLKQLLSKQDIDLSKPDNDGVTVLHRVINTDYKISMPNYMDRFSYFELYRDILSRINVDVNARDNKGRIPLHFINADSFKYLSILLEMGADTEVLQDLREDILKDRDFLKILGQYQLKRIIADLSKDRNIDTLLTEHGGIFEKLCSTYASFYSLEIQRMKETILCDKLTYYDFLHAKKRTCMKIAKISEVRKRLLLGARPDLQFYGFGSFFHYAKMLAKNCLYGARPLTPIESKAITSAEENLDAIFNYKLPNLVVYKINKYIDIEDMISLENVNFTSFCDNK